MMHRTAARGVLTVLLVALAAIGCGDSHDSGERTGQTAAAVSLGITLANEVGRLVSSGNGLARRYYAYDLRGRATTVEHVLDNTPYVFTSTYGFQCSSSACTATTTAANGPVVVASTFPDNETVTHTFDAGGGAQSIVTTPSGQSAQTVVNRVLRNSRGQTVEVDYGDLTSTIQHYDDTTDLRLNEIETYVTATPTTVLQLYQYAFDGNGNVTSVTDTCNESSTGSCSSSQENTTYSASYAYDSRDELVEAIRAGTSYPYGYDTVGNLTDIEGTAQTYFASGAGKPTPHALESVGSVSYQYDPNGNTTGTTGASTNPALTWNAENMPVTAVYGSNTTTKSFVGESMWKKVLGTTTTYYLPSMRVENGAYRKYYGAFAERDISDTTSCSVNAAEGCLKFYHGDHLGSSTMVTNAASAVVHRQAYKPFGEDVVATAPGPFTPKNQFNFKEREADGTGFYDYGARVYNPATGRWLSPDHVLTEARYAYVGNNPLGRVDPSGHWPDFLKKLLDWANNKHDEATPPPPSSSNGSGFRRMVLDAAHRHDAWILSKVDTSPAALEADGFVFRGSKVPPGAAAASGFPAQGGSPDPTQSATTSTGSVLTGTAATYYLHLKGEGLPAGFAGTDPFVSTSTAESVARTFAVTGDPTDGSRYYGHSGPGWVYAISPDESYTVSAEGHFGANNPYSFEKETTFVGSIAPSSILGSYGPYSLTGPTPDINAGIRVTTPNLAPFGWQQ
jgi:RHS repeat-associated protein